MIVDCISIIDCSVTMIYITVCFTAPYSSRISLYDWLKTLISFYFLILYWVKNK